eukprot:30546-Chlamydomonas_euryale.AAC.4
MRYSGHAAPCDTAAMQHHKAAACNSSRPMWYYDAATCSDGRAMQRHKAAPRTSSSTCGTMTLPYAAAAVPCSAIRLPCAPASASAHERLAHARQHV